MAEPLPIRGVNHIAVVTRRLEESRTFYRDVLVFAKCRGRIFDFRAHGFITTG